MFLIICQTLYKNDFDAWANIVSFVANLITIIGIIGLILAYKEYRAKLNEEKRIKINETLHTITSIKSQLITIGHWTAFDKGGYKDADINNWLQRNYLERSNPFHKVYKLDYSYLKNVIILRGIENFDAVNQSLAWLVQWCSNFNSFLDENACNIHR